MKKSWAMKWVKALRSGKYKQTDGALFNGGKHCYLGVLCTLTPYKNNYTKLNHYNNELLPTLKVN